MKTSLQILHLEDDRSDAELIRAELAAGGFHCEMLRVDNRADFTGALQQAAFDVILADHGLPQFDGLSALAIAREIRPDVPFLFVSGTLGEELAIETLKNGATDYVLKCRLSRLAPAVRRALSEAKQRAELNRAQAALLQSEHKYRLLFDSLTDAAFLVDAATGRVLDANKQAETLLGLPRSEIIGVCRDQWLAPPAQDPASLPPAPDAARAPSISFESEIHRTEQSPIPVLVERTPLALLGKPLLLELVRDSSERRQAEKALRQLSVRLLQVEDEERRRIARDLHDTTAQGLAALVMNLSLAKTLHGVRGEERELLLSDGLALAEKSYQEIRTLSYLLHPPLLDETGLGGALRDYAEGFAQRSGLRLQLDLPEVWDRLPPELEMALFRVAQESLGNVNRHSGSPTAAIRLGRDAGEVLLEITDAGRGMPPEQLQRAVAGAAGLGVGLVGMRERMRQLGGRLEITSGPQGTTIRACLPVAESRAKDK